MSIDATVVCDNCREYCHLGQTSGGPLVFGYSENDTDHQREVVGAFIMAHLAYAISKKHTLQIVMTDDIPADYVNAEKRIREALKEETG